jgi:hypothetical protein
MAFAKGVKPKYPSKGRDELLKHGHYLLPRLTWQTKERGRLVLLSAKPGGGKSTLMIQLARQCLTQGEVVIWKGQKNESIFYLPDFEKRCVFFHHENDELVAKLLFRSRKPEILNEDLEIITYKDPVELIQLFQKGKINVVYPPSIWKLSEKLLKPLMTEYSFDINYNDRQSTNRNFFWHELFIELNNRETTEWAALFFDEADKEFPQNASNLEYHMLRVFKDEFRHYRRNFISAYFAVHKDKEFNVQLRSKILRNVYLRKAKVPAESAVFQSVVSRLNRGEMVIDDDGEFGLATFEGLEFNEENNLLVEINPKQEIEYGRFVKTPKMYADEIYDIYETQGFEAAMCELDNYYKKREYVKKDKYYEIRKELQEMEKSKPKDHKKPELIKVEGLE